MDFICKKYENLLIYSKGQSKSLKIAGFDLDHTLIVPKSGNVFPTDLQDWKFFYECIPDKLKDLYKNGYRLIIVTNQKRVDESQMRKKIEDVFSHFDFPIELYAAIADDMYRKPRIGVWNFIQESEKMTIDTDKSFFVGDSAGRRAIVGKKKDYSCCDRTFALNLGIDFFTPEEYFFKSQEIIAYDLPFRISSKYACNLQSYKPSASLEAIILVGCPASGKTTFATKYFISKGYKHISRDSMNTWQKCVTASEKALKNDISIVVDNTNPNIESRKRYIDLAKKYKILCKCFIMTTELYHAKHNEKFRMITERNHVEIPDIAFKLYFKKFETPTLSEGFKEVTCINFIPEFKDPDKEKLYNMYL